MVEACNDAEVPEQAVSLHFRFLPEATTSVTDAPKESSKPCCPPFHSASDLACSGV